MDTDLAPFNILKFSDLSPHPSLSAIVLKTEHRTADNTNHTHQDFYELAVVRRGDGFHILNHEKVTRIFSGCTMLLPPGSVHVYSNYTSISLLNYMFTQEFLDSIKDELKDLPGYKLLFESDDSYGNFPLLLDTSQLLSLTAIAEDIMAEQQTLSPGFSLFIKTKFIDSLLCIIQNVSRITAKTPGSLRLLGILDYLQANYARDLTLPHLASLVNMSVPTLCRHFQAEIGYSPIECLLRIRINKAKQFLSSTSLGLGEIAARCGYHAVSYFTRQFTQRVGIHPRVWRSRPHDLNYRQDEQNSDVFAVLLDP